MVTVQPLQGETALIVRDADNPRDSELVRFGADKPLKLDAGLELAPFQIAYKTYGALNAERTNAVLVCHALTGDQHVASEHPVTGKGGWWETMVGPGKPIDTERYFVICPNVVGACMGTTGPSSTDPKTGKPWGLEFPVITIRDMVRAQAMLLDHLGIETLFAVAGGSMGGMQVLQWAASLSATACSRRCRSPARPAIRRRTSPSTRSAVRRSWPTRNGGAAAIIWKALFRAAASRSRAWARISLIFPTPRCIASSAVNSRIAKIRPFRSTRISRSNPICATKGISFVERFDANSYLYLTRAMDYFDLAADYDGVLANAFKGTPTRFCVISFTSDWLFPTSESRAIVHALNASSARVSFAEIVTDKGHDAFLLEEPELFGIVRGFLDGAGKARGLTRGLASQSKS